MAAIHTAVTAPFQITLDMGHKLLASMEQKAKAVLNLKKPGEKKGGASGGDNKQERNKLSEDEIMRTVQSEYYQEGFDALGDSLQKLPAEVDTKYLDKLLVERERVLDVVNSKLFARVMSSYSAFVQGMTQIHELGLDLQQSTIMCKNGRRNLSLVSDELTHGSFIILYNFRRRQILSQIMQDLMAIKSISTLQQQLSLIMNQGDYPKAIQVCLQARDTAKQCSHFSVVKDLDSTLQDTYNIMQDRLDKALFESCRNFTPTTYERVLYAYKLLGTTARIVERLQPFFVDPIESDTKNILLAHVLLSSENMQRAEQLKNLKFKELCSVVTEDHYVNCLLTVLENLCDVMSSHYAMTKWHQDHQTAEESKWFAEILVGLNRFKKTIWDVMQRKVSDMLASVQLISFKVDDFLKVVEGVTLFLDVGCDFSGITAPNLRNTLTVQSKNFLENFHKQRVEDLRTMLENEMWARCPVTPSFAVGNVKEFRAPLTAPILSTGLRGADKRFSSIAATGNPFSKMIQYARKRPDPEQKAAEVDDDEESSDLLVDYVDEDADNPLSPNAHRRKQSEDTLRSGGPLLASTTINTVSILGKYVNMLRVLHQPLAFEIFVAVTHIYEYYLHSIFTFFGVPPPGVNAEEMLQTLGYRLRKTLQRLKEKFGSMTPTTLLQQIPDGGQILQKISNTSATIVDDVLKVKWVPARVSSSVAPDLTNSKTTYGLGIRTVGIESLLFLQDALNEAKPLLMSLLPPTGVELLNTFYNNEVAVLPELRTYMYKIVCAAFLNTDSVVTNIANSKWEVLAVPVNNSPYVDVLLREFVQFGQRVDRAVPLPPKVKSAVWEAAIVRAMDQLVEGYSRIKKCTNEGRAILLQDLKAIQNGLAQIAPLRGNKVPAVPYAENYITAYYLPLDNDIVEWAKEHPEYLLRHTVALVNVNPAAGTNRNKRVQVTAALEELDRVRRGGKP